LELDLRIFCPVYYDVPSFLELQKRIAAALPEKKIFFYVVDDSAGGDVRMQEIHSLPNVKIFRPPVNLGHQRAIVYGLRSYFADPTDEAIIVTMDGDGEDDPQDIARLLKAYSEGGGKAVVFASRTTRDVSFWFKFCYFFYEKLFRILTGMKVKSGSFCVAHPANLKRVIFHPYFEFCYASALQATLKNKIFVPCARAKRIEGDSKMSFTGMVGYGIKTLLPHSERVALRGMIFFSLLLLGTLLSFIALGAAKFFLGIGFFDHFSFFGGFLLLTFLSLATGFTLFFTQFAKYEALAFARLLPTRPQQENSGPLDQTKK
jgi:hypothetical protein